MTTYNRLNEVYADPVNEVSIWRDLDTLSGDALSDLLVRLTQNPMDVIKGVADVISYRYARKSLDPRIAKLCETWASEANLDEWDSEPKSEED